MFHWREPDLETLRLARVSVQGLLRVSIVAVQYAYEPGQVIVLNPKSYPPVGGHWTVDLDLPSGGDLVVAAVDGTYFGDDIGFARMYDQGGTVMQPSYQDDSAVRFDGLAAGSWHFEVAVYTAGRHDMMFELGGSTARASNNALTPGAFVTTWQTTSAGETITIPIRVVSDSSYTVAWGDGNVTTHAGPATHTYASAGNHTVSISGDDLTIHLSSDISNAVKLVSIDQWGDVQWESMHRAFYRASNMIYNAADVPDLSDVRDMSFMFGSASSFDGDLSGWDVSGVRTMSGMFWEASSFNGNISTWDVSSVTDMYSMFNGASKFNGDLSEWDVSGVTNMRSTFARAPVFDSDLSEWDVSGVRSMSGMFKSAEVFNSDISDWDVSGVTDMERLFSFAYNFDGDISDWDVSGVTDMEGMFNHADSFNGNISGWNVSSVTNMRQMFWENQIFNADISGWDVSSVTNMEWMFDRTRVFNGDLSKWDVSGVTDMGGMFYLTPAFNSDLSKWDVSGVTDMGGMFSNAQNFNADISGWDVSGVTDMEGMFNNAQNFNADISGWDVSGVTDMENMFRSAFDFEQNLGNWYVVLDSTEINAGDAPGMVGRISAQNQHLDSQKPKYRLVAGGDSDSFEITDGSSLNMIESPDKAIYTVNITSTGSFGTSNNRVYSVTVTDHDTTDPTITITGANPISVTTGTAYSDPGATCTDDTDASPTLTTASSVDTLTAGTYQVTYTCTDSSSNTATATRNVVVADAPDTTAPTVSSIERHIPTGQNTGNQTLVYQVTFSENVTDVDAGDFVLSPGSPVAGGASGQFAQTSEPAIPIPDRSTVQDSIAVEQSGTATSVSVAVDVTHSYIGDLVIDLIAPDGTTRTLHDRTGYETDDIDRTYAPDFGGVGIEGDWTLRVRDSAGGDTGTLNGWTLTINHSSTASPATAVSGSGDTYQVTVLATQDGTYNLDLVSSGHGIVDEAGNPLADTTPTGTDHTYTVSTAT